MLFREIRNRASRRVLDVPDGDAHTERVQQFTSNGGRNQQWAMQPIPDTPFVEVVCRATGRGLSVPDFDARMQGQHVVLVKQEPHAQVAGQSWSVFREDDGFDTIDSALAPIAVRAIREDGGLEVEHWLNEMVLGVPNGEAEDGGAVQLSPFNGGENQRWEIRTVDDVDPFLIVSVHSNKVLDVPGFAAAAGPVQQFDYNGGPNQLWQLLDINGQPFEPYPAVIGADRAGPVSIVSVATGKALHIDDQGGLAQAEPSGAQDQHWLVPYRELSQGGFNNPAFVIQNQQTGLFLATDRHVADVGQQPDAGFDTQGWYFVRAPSIFQPGLWTPGF